MNNWNFTGNVGKDATIRTTSNNKTLCDFSVAVTSGYGDNKKTTWANCVIFGKRAEGQLPGYLVKGQQVAISGEVTLRAWESDGGKKGTSLDVFVNSLDLVGEKKAPAQQVPAQAAEAMGQPPVNQDGLDAGEELPF
jgi:single-strand DNA-binding protein